MTRPVPKPSHELIVQTPKGNSYYKVVETDKLQEGIAEVTIIAGALQAIITGEWLDRRGRRDRDHLAFASGSSRPIAHYHVRTHGKKSSVDAVRANSVSHLTVNVTRLAARSTVQPVQGKTRFQAVLSQ